MTEKYKLPNGEVSLEKSICDEELLIRDVRASLDGSTRGGQILNIALKLLTTPSFDPILYFVDELIDERIIELATGTQYSVFCETKKHGKHTVFIVAKNKKRAKELVLMSYPKYTVEKVEKYVPKKD